MQISIRPPKYQGRLWHCVRSISGPSPPILLLIRDYMGVVIVVIVYHTRIRKLAFAMCKRTKLPLAIFVKPLPLVYPRPNFSSASCHCNDNLGTTCCNHDYYCQVLVVFEFVDIVLFGLIRACVEGSIAIPSQIDQLNSSKSPQF